MKLKLLLLFKDNEVGEKGVCVLSSPIEHNICTDEKLFIPLSIKAALIVESIPANTGADAEVPETKSGFPSILIK